MACSNPRRSSPVTHMGSEMDSFLSLKTSKTLRKGATFHASPSTSPTFAPPSLPRAQSELDDVVDANRRRMALTLEEINEVFSKAEKLSISSPDSSKKTFRDNSLPVPRGFLDLSAHDSTMGTAKSDRRVLRPRSVRHSKQHLSDSGIGSSIVSSKEKCVAGNYTKTANSQAPAIARSVASSTKEMMPSLGRRAVNRIHEHIIRPLVSKPTLNDFQPIVADIPRRINAKEIICLRDLEKTLLFMAPENAKMAALYLDFCFTSIRCIQATVEYLNDREQVRPEDRPYTNGYFIDLKQQVYQYGQQLAAAKEKSGVDSVQAEEIRLHGGMAENGRPAELVRVSKDGTMVSLATGKVVDEHELPITFKRSMSEQKEDEEEIMRSMARRKKNASPEELAPKRCREPGCTKEFKRPCDLTKHEKTHSRPWKCPIPTCKYHDFGWPTEKEMDRHVNDKHSDAPAMFECLFKPCPYKSKRQSNCKQHMEKAHGWVYNRTKTNIAKKVPSQPASTAQQTPQLADASTPSTTQSWGVPTPPQDNQLYMTDSDLPMYPNSNDWFATYGIQPDTIDNMDLTLENNPSPSSSNPADQYPPYQNGPSFIIDEDIYAAPLQMPSQNPMFEQMYQKMMMQQPQPPQQPQMYAPAPQASAPLQQFSTTAQDNPVLYSPSSLQELDDGLDGSYAQNDGGDFQLFPGNVQQTKGNDYQLLFGEVPSANLGFSQTTQPEIFQQIDWSDIGCHTFPGQGEYEG